MNVFPTKLAVLEEAPTKLYGSLKMARDDCRKHLRTWGSGHRHKDAPALLVDLEFGRVAVVPFSSGSFRVVAWPLKLWPSLYDSTHVTIELLLDWLEANASHKAPSPKIETEEPAG